MNKLTEQEIEKAYYIWKIKRYSESQDPENLLKPFLSNEIKPASTLNLSWLRIARNGLFLSAQSVADKLGITRAAYSKYEECEESGTITLNTLAIAAEIMDCELVYAIRPKNKKLFSQIIWEKLLPVAKLHSLIKNCNPKRKPEALATIASQCMTQTQFRKKQNWSQRKS